MFVFQFQGSQKVVLEYIRWIILNCVLAVIMW